MNEELDDATRSGLCIEFALKATAARAEIEKFADTLAGGDQELRQQLRLIAEGLW